VQEVETYPCKDKLELDLDLNFCVTHLRLRGLRGEKSTPKVGWEVPVKSCD
jgi:hypothetical protein